MGRKKSKRRDREEEDDAPGFELNPETKRGIVIVFLFALSALILLSLFGIAGELGSWIDMTLDRAFGWDRSLIPIVFILVGFALLYPERTRISFWNYLGFFFFFLSFNAVVNVLVPPDALGRLPGGFMGELLRIVLGNAIGFWGSLVVLGALLVVSLLLIFNTSLSGVFGWHRTIGGLFTGRFRPRNEMVDETTDENVDTSEEEDGSTSEEEAGAEETLEETREDEEEKEEARTKETVLTTRHRRQMTIPINLLAHHAGNANAGDVDRNRDVIGKTFEQFGIPVEMGETTTGPTVAQYTMRPAQGIKLSRIVALQNDIALALAAHPIRIEAPIPGKSLVGIEVPNQRIAKVSLRDLLESREFKKREHNLSVPIGVDVSSIPFVAPINKMPHLLVAGATGSGKSVCLNTLIISLLYQNGPDDLKLILVDPKRVELTAYNGIPHLLVPPITKVDDTVNALKWTVREMDRRLDVLSKFGARDIASFNARSQEQMPAIVVIIDELADLMSMNGREIEATIVRIAQMARAVGIHLVLATQRPSVDVITGLIKANFPARIAFAVASQTDSRTILDCAGAEKLLGRGDMLFTTAELSKPKRLQAPFVSEDEVNAVVKFLRQEGLPDYNYAVTETQKTGSILDGSADDEPLLEEAIRAVLSAGRASTSLLQRRLKVGYARAARMMDILEDKGVVGPGDGAKPREILIEEWPPGGDMKEAMPTAQDDYEKAGSRGDEGDDSDEEMEDVGEKEKDESDEEGEGIEKRGESESDEGGGVMENERNQDDADEKKKTDDQNHW